MKYCKRFYLFYAIGQQAVDQLENAVLRQQGIDQIPWGHNILIFTKSESVQEAFFYIQKTIENNWSRRILGSKSNQDYFPEPEILCQISEAHCLCNIPTWLNKH